MQDELAIRVEHVRKTYEEYGTHVNVFEDLNLDVRRGEFVVVVGPTGCGKTTLINIIAGLDRPESGSVYVDSVDITKLPDDEVASLRAKKVGVIFQAHNLIPSLPVYENVELPLVLQGISRNTRRGRIEEMLRMTGLAQYAWRKVATLSVGERQMVTFARALAPAPEIILMDEPTEHLDPLTTEVVLGFVRSDTVVRDKTVLLTTHKSKVAGMADRIIHLKKKLP